MLGAAFSTRAIAQDADSYEIHPEGQFAGLTGHDILDASDQAAADGEAAAATGDWSEAYAAYSWASRFRRMVYLDSNPAQFDVEHHLAEAASQTSFFLYARRHFENAYENRLRLLGPDHPDTLDSLSGYASVLIELAQDKQSLSILKPALDRAESKLGPDHQLTIDLAQQYGRAMLLENRTKEAVQIFTKLLADRTRAGPADAMAVGVAATDLAMALVRMRAYDRAEPLVRQALSHFDGNKAVRRTDVARAIAARGDIALARGDPSSAETDFRLAITTLEEMGSGLPLTLELNRRLGQALLMQPAKRVLALDPLKIAVSDRAATGAIWTDSSSRKAQRLLLDAYAAQPVASSGKAFEEEAFSAMLQAFDDSADKAIISAIGRNTDGTAGDLIRAREQLVTERSRLQSDYAAAQGSGLPEARKLRVKLKLNADAILETEVQIRQEYPEFFDFLEQRALSIDDPHALLEPGEALMMIVPSELSTHVFFFTHDRRSWTQSSAGRSEIDLAVRKLLWDVGAPNDVSLIEADGWLDEMAGQGAYPYSFAEAAFLHDQLFGQIDLTGIDHIFLISDGSLAQLPLGLLVSKIPEGRSGDPETLRSADWLADRVAFSILPSLQTLHFLRNHRASGESAETSEFIGIGDPRLEGQAKTRGSSAVRRGSGALAQPFSRVFGSNAGSNQRSGADVSALRALARLPGTADELTQLWASFGSPEGNLLLEDLATETAIKSRPLRAQLIAFATHGLLAGEIRGLAEPGLVLTPPAEATPMDDGYLATSDIAALKLDAEWVILSACNTAASDGSSGSSGLSGLARSFFFAGVRNLLVSHWPVRDDVAARMTVKTVGLTRGKKALSRAKALSKAMKEIRDNPAHDSANDTWAHPNAWAPFSFVGDGSAR